MKEKDFEFYASKENDNTMEEEIKHYFGVKVDKIAQGFSVGICFSYDKWLEETYLYINLFKWSISIGWLLRTNNNDDEC